MHQSRQQVLCHPTIDPGCGAGNSTEVLIQRFPNATVAGVDNYSDDVGGRSTQAPKAWANYSRKPGTWLALQCMQSVKAADKSSI